ncbi:type II secretion system protein [Salinibacterium sp. ZJ450]|uniref:type II secretion system protein n=1 Tax=Salinibacterium sp. ZJ450 TaxID=2708338 RepID=UPI0014249F8D|nr:type II secretion system protein [Salinibacterium sp. ZJ450]
MSTRMKSERGMTLIELVIYSMLAVVVLTIVGGILINSINADKTVREASNASSSAQLVSQSFTHGVRHARELERAVPFAGAEVLRALIVDNAVSSPAAAHCEAWYFGAGEIRTTRSSSAIPLPVDATDVADWTLLAEGADPITGVQVFAQSDLTAALTVQVATGDEQPVLIETTAVSRQPDVIPIEVESLCF